MNLTGVLLEGSLKRDALGLLSFIGLSWLLVPFQAYASVKALFEKKEGGWVRTPKSGHVTEALERFHLARLMPWELPRRKRGQQKQSGTGRVAAVAAVVLAAAGIITVGALSIRAAATSGSISETDLAVPALVGTAVPLLVLALGWLRLRRRMTAVVLAFTLGLGTNVVYLASAVPAAAATDNSSVFTFGRTMGYDAGNLDMKQNYTPSGASTTCVTAGTICTYFSDTFTTGQTMNAGTAQADLYLSNAVQPITFQGGANSWGDSTICGPTWPGWPNSNTAKGDVLIAACAFRGGSAVTITPPDASWIPLTRIDNGTVISVATFYHVVASSFEFSTTGNVQFTLGSSQKFATALYSYAGVDNTNPVDVQNGQATASGTSHAALGVTTTTANDLLITFHAVAGSTTNQNQWTPPAAMSERGEWASATGSNASNAGLEGNELLLGAAGATGNQTATSVYSAFGATKTIALRPATTCTVTATLKKVNPIWLRGATTMTVNSGTSVAVDVPAGTQQNDVMYVYLAFAPIGASITTPVGWTQGSSSGATGIQVYTYRRVAGASEPANYTWTFNITTNIAAWAGSYVGVDTTTPTDLTLQTSDSGTPTTHTTNTRLVAVEDEMVVLGVAIAGNVTHASASGMTPEGNPIAGTSTFASLGMFDGIQGARAYINRTTTSSPGGSADMVMLTLRPATLATTLGSGTASLAAGSGTTLVSTGAFSTAAATFATGDQLELDLVASSECAGSLSYDGASEPSKLTIATIVPEGVAGLLLLAPALPIGLRWWKRRRP
jgi:hypothetical protein